MTTPTPPTVVLVDVDALVDLDPWEALAQKKRWIEFFGHIPDATPRDNGLLDVLDLAAGDGCRVTYTSRWPSLTLYLIREWLDANGFPQGYAWTRRNGDLAPAALADTHAREAGKKQAPVLVIHADTDAAAALRREHGIAALGVAQLPATVEGLRRVFGLARPVPANTPTTKETSR